MTRRLFAGIDGGGTKTHFVLVDQDATLIAEHRGGSSYHLQVGLDGVQSVLAEGLAAVTAQAGITPDQIEFAFFGLPAFGEDSVIDPVLARIPAQILGHTRYRCGNDMVCGWAGSLGGADGISIVAGTGSIGYGERQGASARAGGWGEAFGDEGSAFWVAVQGLNAFSRMSDGRLPRGPLYDAFRSHFGLTSDFDICGRIMGDAALPRDQIATLSTVVAAAALAGDEVAMAIYDRAGHELALVTDAIHAALGFDDNEPVAVSYSGGLFAANELVRRPFATQLERLGKKFTLLMPKFSPSQGAALLAILGPVRMSCPRPPVKASSASDSANSGLA